MIKNFFKSVKLRHLIALVFLLMFNSFAWFIYSTKVANSINAHVKSWKIMFVAGDQEITNNIEVNVDEIYPGMPTYVKEIKVYNKSEVSATMSYEILKARILDEEFITKEGMIENDQVPSDDNITSVALINNLKNNYPFKIDVSLNNNEVSPEVGEALYKIKVSWPYESENDDIDTLWGNKAYNYNAANPSTSSISLKIKLMALQN